MVGFGDAGTEMLCTAIYLRLLDKDRNQIDYAFICAKSYTVPYRQSRTIPDLEVDVACKLSILMNKIEASHNIKFNERLHFTDNNAVKEWILNGARNPKIYVYNRLEKIKKYSKPEEWRWTPTHLQPADFGTKMSSMPTISFSNDWFHPNLFSLPEANWPIIDANISYHIYNTNNSEEVSSEDSFILKFSNYQRLINAVFKCMEWKYRVEIIKILSK